MLKYFEHRAGRIAPITNSTEQLKAIEYGARPSRSAQLSQFDDAKLAVIERPAWYGFSKVSPSMIIRDTQLAVNHWPAMRQNRHEDPEP